MGAPNIKLSCAPFSEAFQGAVYSAQVDLSELFATAHAGPVVQFEGKIAGNNATK